MITSRLQRLPVIELNPGLRRSADRGRSTLLLILTRELRMGALGEARDRGHGRPHWPGAARGEEHLRPGASGCRCARGFTTELDRAKTQCRWSDLLELVTPPVP